MLFSVGVVAQMVAMHGPEDTVSVATLLVLAILALNSMLMQILTGRLMRRVTWDLLLLHLFVIFQSLATYALGDPPS